LAAGFRLQLQAPEALGARLDSKVFKQIEANVFVGFVRRLVRFEGHDIRLDKSLDTRAKILDPGGN
jgi:hypothetical protein